MLAFCLAAVVVVSLVLCGWVYVRVSAQVDRNDPPRLTSDVRSALFGYTIFVAAALMFALLFLIGYGEHGKGSGAFEKEQLSQLAHVGYYFDAKGGAEDDPLRAIAFGAQAEKGMFFHPAFREGERLRLRPTGTSKRDSFRVSYTSLSRPLRLDGRSVNIPSSAWFAPEGGTLRIARRLPGGGAWRSHTFRWEQNVAGEDIENRFYHYRGRRRAAPRDTAQRNATPASDPAPGAEAFGTLVSEAVLREGQALSWLLRASRTPEADSIWQRTARAGEALQAAFSGVRFVREQMGDPTSRLGVMVADTLLDRPDLRFYVNGEALSSDPSSGEAILQAGQTIRYGLGEQRLFAVQAPYPSNRGGDQYKNADYWVALENARRWRLPPHPQDHFALITGREKRSEASTDGRNRELGAVPLDGYRIGAVPPAWSRYALGRFNEDVSALTVNTGLHEYPVSRLDTFAVGARAGVLLSMRPQQAFVSPQVAWLSDLGNLFLDPAGLSVPGWISSVLEWISSFRLPYVGPMAALIVALMALWHSWHLWTLRSKDDYARKRPRVETAWTLVWSLTLTLLVVRLILSYRVALLPPPDASPAERALLTGKNLQISFWALLLIPLLMRTVRWFARPEPTWLTRLIDGARSLKLVRWPRERVFRPAGDAVRRASKRAADRAHGLVSGKLAPIEGGLLAVATWGVLAAALVAAGTAGALPSFLSESPYLSELDVSWRAALGVHVLVVALVAGAGTFLQWRGLRPVALFPAIATIAAVLLVIEWRAGGLRIWAGSADLTLVAASMVVALLLLFAWRAFLVLAGAVALLGVAWASEQFGPLRANLTAHGLLVIALAATAGYLTDLSLGKRAIISFLTATALGAFTFVTGDFGFVLLAISLGVALLMLLSWRSGPEELPERVRAWMSPRWQDNVRDWWRVGAFALLALFGVVLYQAASSSFFEEVVLPNAPDRASIRFATLEYEAPERLATWEYGQAQSYLGADQQIWQMLLYAAEGTRSVGGHGYGEAPLSDRAITYPTALTDGAFGTFLLAEHGWGGGISLLSVYLLLGLACLWIGAPFTDGTRHRLLPLAAIGTYFAFNALYMVSANLGLVVFTGQNVPLLSLLSRSDLLHGTLMLVVVAYLSKAGLASESRYRLWSHLWHENRASSQGAAYAVMLLLTVGLVVGVFFVGKEMRAGLDPDLRKDFSFDTALFEKFDTKAGQMPSYEVVGKDIRWDNVRKEAPLLETYVARFNERPDYAKDRRGNGSPLFLNEQGEVEVDATFYNIPSPFQGAQRDWRGAVTAAAAADAYAWAGTPLATLPLAVSQDSAGTPVITPEEDAELRVGGAEHNGPLNLASLRPESVVSVQHPETGRWQNALYLGRRAQPLMQTVWRNGDYESIYPQRSTAPLAYGIKEAAQATPEASADTIQLSLDLDLHERLQKAVSDFARAQGYRPADELGGRRLAVSVADAHSGEVRALAAWPFRHPQSRRFTQVLDSLDAGSAKENFLTNPNFQEHAIGSTFKPLLLSTVTAGLWGELAIEDLTLRYDGADTRLAGLPLDPENPWDNRNHYAGTADVRAFIRESNNAYLGKLGMLGTYIDKSEIGGPTMPPTWNDWKIRSPQFSDSHRRGFDLTALKTSPFEPRADGTGLRPERLRQTVLFQSLPRLFDVHFAPTPDTLQTGIRAQTFLPSLGTGTPKLKRIVPQPFVLNVSEYQTLRSNLVSFFLGSGDNLRTPVDMTQALARVVTGHRVTATLEPRDSLAPAFPEGEGVLPPRTWRNAYLIAPMEQVWSHPEGTMKALRSDIPEWIASAEEANAGSNYRVLMKTGTLDVDGSGPEGLSKMLVFMVGRWRGSDADGQFVPGQTVAGHFHMEDVGTVNGKTAAQLRNAFAREVVPEVIAYVGQLEPDDGGAP